jgi:hypothetical protein
VSPVAVAIASSVSLDDTVIEPEYRFDEVDGAVPFVV